MANYRNATLLDLDRIIKLNELSLPENYPSDHWKSLLMDPGSKGLSFVALDPNNKKYVLGYIIGYLIQPDEHEKEAEIRLYSLAVSEKARKRGIGNKLVELFVNAAKTKNLPISLHVRASNTPAIELYRKHHFKVRKLEEKYYSNPEEDALYMRYTDPSKSDIEQPIEHVTHEDHCSCGHAH